MKVRVDKRKSKPADLLRRLREKARNNGTLGLMLGESKPSALPSRSSERKPPKQLWQRDPELALRGPELKKANTQDPQEGLRGPE